MGEEDPAPSGAQPQPSEPAEPVGTAAGPNRGTPGLGIAGRGLDPNPHIRVRIVPRDLGSDGPPRILLLQFGDGGLTPRPTPVLGIDPAPSPDPRNATP